MDEAVRKREILGDGAESFASSAKVGTISKSRSEKRREANRSRNMSEIRYQSWPGPEARKPSEGLLNSAIVFCMALT